MPQFTLEVLCKFRSRLPQPTWILQFAGWLEEYKLQAAHLVLLLIYYHNDASLNGTIYFAQTTPSLY